MTKPISPIDASQLRNVAIPDEVIQAINSLIVKNLRGRGMRISSKFKAVDLIDLTLANFKAAGKYVTSQELYDNGWMGFEDLYQTQGWKITYDRPGYNENYDSTYEFQVSTRVAFDPPLLGPRD